MLHHRRQAEDATQYPNSSIRQKMTVEVVHDDAETADSVHLAQELDGRRTMKVMKEESCVGDVEPIVLVGKVQGVLSFETSLSSKGRGKGCVQPGATVSDDQGI